MRHTLQHPIINFVQPFHCVRPTTGPSSISRTTCNINNTSDPSREDEIAAKIAKLRKEKRLKSQNSSSTDNAETSTGLSFNDLPDLKKEQVLKSQIADAENFFYGKPNNERPITDSSKSASDDQSDYQPKVSTWGVFPRPDNISKTFGGGRRIKPGGVKLDSSESREYDDTIKKRLAAYRASRGIDTEKEDAHREEIESALADAEKMMKRTLPYEATSRLEQVIEFTSDRSRLGGRVLLSLALAHEAAGRRLDAREIYMRLRRSPFPEISRKAKQLFQGFEAMEQLQIVDETKVKGYRVTRFSLPDMNFASDKRYETVVQSQNAKTDRPERLSIGLSLTLFGVIGGPAFLIAALILLRR